MDEDMNEYLLEAREELKRLEHIIYVSLKYTRTVDVIINALNRMVSTYDLIIEAFLEKASEEGLIDSLPKSPALRGKKFAELYADDELIQKNLKFYSSLRVILNSTHRKRQEFRRHVTLIVDMEKSTVEVDIDLLTNCERFIHQFLLYSRKIIDGYKEED
ncbi:MAG: hypothetical protein ABH824_00350 [Nanoarchaeota archaeon]|nr:hypothetical protein [Nanoarchaeota archaeon]MBU1632870.1 hypothetical protein [Nanoarchaeota archaeon]MBU1876676.1 hypothetical protein [Nanoarchaeota archaeon]